MNILKIEDNPFHEVNFKSSGPRGAVRYRVLPFYKVKVEKLPKGVTSIVATSDLQGREAGDENRLLGEAVAEELMILQELGEIPKIELVILAGDLYDYPDCRKKGGTGDVTSVWNAFAKDFGAVVGVQPFGGEGLSGTGPKAGGPHYLDRLCCERTFSVNTTASGGNATLMALGE